jgi:erythromycin esterase-like protein/predicted phosphoribosyltransferase
MARRLFRDRHQAGQLLASKLVEYAERSEVLVLALPRGGVPVAYEVARSLDVPMDVFVVRKLGVPGYEELAFGAIATGGTVVLNDDVVEALEIPQHVSEAVIGRETEELRRRERLYRGGRPSPDPAGRIVILVDDGLATGATMEAAVEALRRQHPLKIVAAVPIAPAETCERLKQKADEVLCAVTPTPFLAVGYWYEDFSQTTDDEVRELLFEAQQREREPPAAPAAVSSPVEAIRESARRLTGVAEDYDSLLELIGSSRFALLGEASHGTHEFYRERARITRRLILEKGFRAVAVEADWPDAYRVNRYVHGASDDVDATEALSDFRRFPTWMWRNTEVAEFVEWLRAHNDSLPAGTRKVGFFGLDLYSLHASMKAVLHFLERVDPEAAKRARERYACFERFENEQVYGLIASTGASKSCQDAAVRQLVELQQRARQYPPGVSEDEIFFVEQNARLVVNAETYYRTVFLGDSLSWNVRDRHMAETLEALAAHLARQDAPARIAVWEHNSHLGDARATEPGERGQLNVGQLVREKYGRDAVLVGFTTYHGTVTAASDWGAPAERKRVRPAMPGSVEALFHASLPARFLLPLRDASPAESALREERLERAIGVIYRPETERGSHYFRARLSGQFDAVLHLDETQALEPLERNAEWEAGELPQTYPVGV